MKKKSTEPVGSLWFVRFGKSGRLFVVIDKRKNYRFLVDIECLDGEYHDPFGFKAIIERFGYRRLG